MDSTDKSSVRRLLRQKIAAMTDAERQAKSQAACLALMSSPEFDAAQVIMLYLSMPHEVDTSAIALRCWQSGKTVVVPKVSWNQRRMLPMEIASLQRTMESRSAAPSVPDAMKVSAGKISAGNISGGNISAGSLSTGEISTGADEATRAPFIANFPQPMEGKPVPVNLLDLVIVPGVGFTADGHRIGRGMGFYDRFLAQSDFIGLSCGLAFEEQVLEKIPVLDHDMSLSMLVTDQGIRRFATPCMEAC
jgi:5-formyltetrahydrofolate cyclo-ligase